jgi:hypothetical protein
VTGLRAIIGAAPTWVAVAATGFLGGILWYQETGGNFDPPVLLAPVATGVLDGTWLTGLAVRLFSALPLPWPLETTLAAVAASAMGVLLAWLYQRLIYNDWSVAEALLFIGCLAANAIVIGSVTGDYRAIPIMIACIALIPGIRRMESVGDVQAVMSFGLVLPLLFLAGPAMTPLIPVLALWGALSDPTARRDARAFFAMFLVAIMPTLLVMTGMFGMLGATEAARVFYEIYVPAFSPHLLEGENIQALLRFTTYAVLPFGIVTIAYMFHRDRRWQPWSAVAVLGLPFYLVAGATLFSWPAAPIASAAAVLGAFASWLSVARLTPIFRWMSIVVMLLATVVSWSAPVLMHQFQGLPA